MVLSWNKCNEMDLELSKGLDEQFGPERKVNQNGKKPSQREPGCRGALMEQRGR
jgi:hypothetical protein